MGLETAYCAETVAITYEEMGLLVTEKDSNWFDPGRSGAATRCRWRRVTGSATKSPFCHRHSVDGDLGELRPAGGLDGLAA